jgi:hypothetical protein
MFTALCYFFGVPGFQKEWYLLLTICDIVVWCAVAILFGLLGWETFVFGLVAILLCGYASRRYFDWRERRRVTWRSGGMATPFPYPWMAFTDLVGDEFRPPMTTFYIMLLLLGRFSIFAF